MKSSIWVSLVFVTFAWGCGGGDGPDSPQQKCDTTIAGNICTIAGNGENGYDNNAETEALDALHARMSLPQDTLTAPRRHALHPRLEQPPHSQPERRRQAALGGGTRRARGNPRRSGQWRLQSPHQHHLRPERRKHHHLGVAQQQDPDAVDRTPARSSTPAAMGSARTSVTTAPRSRRRSICRRVSRSTPRVSSSSWMRPIRCLRFIDGAGDIHKLAGQCIIDAPSPSGPGPCAAGVMPVQCPDGPNGPSGKWTCGDPTEWCSKPCTPGYSGDEIPASGDAHVAAVRTVGDACRAHRVTMATAICTSRTRRTT